MRRARELRRRGVAALAIGVIFAVLFPAGAGAISSYPVTVVYDPGHDFCSTGYAQYTAYDSYYFEIETDAFHGDCFTDYTWPAGDIVVAANVYDSGYPAHYCGHFGNYTTSSMGAGIYHSDYATACYGQLGVWGYHYVYYGYPGQWYEKDALPGFVGEYI